MVNTTNVWASGIMNLNEESFKSDDDNTGIDSSWNSEKDDDSFDESMIKAWESGVQNLNETELIEDHPQDHEAKPQYPAEDDAFKNDPTKDDAVPDLMKDDNSTETVEMESFIW